MISEKADLSKEHKIRRGIIFPSESRGRLMWFAGGRRMKKRLISYIMLL
jgi:hypothetical protein